MPSAFFLRRFYLVFLYFLCWLNPSYRNQKSQNISTSLFMTPNLLCWVTTLYIFCPSFEKGHSKDTCPSFFFFFNNFIYFWPHWIFISTHGLSLSCSEWGPLSSCYAWASNCSGLSHCRVWAPGHYRLQQRWQMGSVVVVPGL